MNIRNNITETILNNSTETIPNNSITVITDGCLTAMLGRTEVADNHHPEPRSEVWNTAAVRLKVAAVVMRVVVE